MGADMKTFYSHPDKLLSEHLLGVVEKTRRRTPLRMAEIAALFHDLGKINPNFQRKLQGEKEVGYSSHAYLSALAWLCYCQVNKEKLKDLIGIDPAHDLPSIFSIAAMIARHHGNLPNLEKDGFFKEREQKALREFLELASADDLPISEFLQQISEHHSFDIKPSSQLMDILIFEFQWGFQHVLEHIEDPLDFFMNTQFSFACLIESDKRDAGNNVQFNKERYGIYIKQNFAARLEKYVQELPQKSDFDSLRTEMRVQAVENIAQGLSERKRVFTLSAPTGAGKTLMLLSLAAEVLKHDAELNIIYALPFLSITEQTEVICKSIYCDESRAVLRIDSKSENKEIDRIQRELDANPTDDNLCRLMREIFSESTFDHPFIITTFVQLFEALVSNRNSTLLRLPNFARTIFLLDEIQALPPRLYTFFTAYLDEFCRKFDSYAIISTATMPYVEIPDKDVPCDENPRLLFKRYNKPCELLNKSFYRRDTFNRYSITRLERDDLHFEDLSDIIRRQSKSCLVILNTIDDTKQLHNALSRGEDILHNDEFVLLNSHFTPNDRERKIELCKQRLRDNKRVVLISTQLIEAGVDIDFPLLYRDMCPLPNLIQSAGRCNRNGKQPSGEVYLFELKKENGKASASYIYEHDLGWFLNFTKEHVKGTIPEKEMYAVQQKFFHRVEQDLHVGLHKQAGGEINMVRCINHMAFDDLGKFRLIDEESFGTQFRYYVKDDGKFEELQERLTQLDFRIREFKVIAHLKSKVEEQLRRMAGDIVSIRLVESKIDLAPVANAEAVGIRKIGDPDDYSSITGIKLSGPYGCII
jgi:CRISPR-associated endonuclease/helicase Cas3